MLGNLDTGVVRPKPVVVCVLDGWGIGPADRGNAITLAQTPNMSKAQRIYPAIPIQASGDYVGLKWGEIGNSEVGHLNIGAGLVFYQNLPRLDKELRTGDFYKNPILIKMVEDAKAKKTKIHITGLCSSGGVHAHIDHLIAILDFFDQQNFSDFYVHAITDGRDTPFNSGKDFLQTIENKLNEIKKGKIATVSGRYFSMDRDNRWERIEKSYNAIVLGQSEKKYTSVETLMTESYAAGVYDEQIPPTVITDSSGNPLTHFEDGDTLLFFNYRSDRARQLTRAFCIPNFDSFARPKFLSQSKVYTLLEYEKGLPVEVVYPPIIITKPIAKIVSDAGLKQLHISETEKYAHVTFFFNGGIETPFEGEERIVIPSPRIASFDQKPEMSCIEITDRLIQEMNTGKFDFIVVNYANPDMVAHTGNLEATIEAIETVDWQIGRLMSAVLAVGGVLVITADHGNAEGLINLQTGEIDKEHSTSPVPLMIIGKEWEGMTLVPGMEHDLSLVQPVGVLADVAPTLLKIMGLRQPEEMTGVPLI